MIHTENFILIDKKKRIRGFYDGTDRNEIDKLMEDIEILKREIIEFTFKHHALYALETLRPSLESESALQRKIRLGLAVDTGNLIFYSRKSRLSFEFAPFRAPISRLPGEDPS